MCVCVCVCVCAFSSLPRFVRCACVCAYVRMSVQGSTFPSVSLYFTDRLKPVLLEDIRHSAVEEHVSMYADFACPPTHFQQDTLVATHPPNPPQSSSHFSLLFSSLLTLIPFIASIAPPLKWHSLKTLLPFLHCHLTVLKTSTAPLRSFVQQTTNAHTHTSILRPWPKLLHQSPF